MRQGQDRTSKIAPGTLSLAAVGSASATFLLGSFGLAGTVVGAALTPVIVALVSELVRRPAKTVTVRTAAIRTGATEVRRPERTVNRYERRGRISLDRVPWKRVAVTGVAAFAVVVAAVSIADLASGGSVASGRGSTFFSPGEGGSSKTPAPADQSPASTTRSETTETTTEPAEEGQPTETTVTEAPPATTTTTPPETTTTTP